MVKAKATGNIGSWLAEVNGELLPCVHRHWLRGMTYHDPQAIPGDRKWDDFVGAIRRGRVILTSDDVSEDERVFNRKEYIAIFAVEDVQMDGNGLTFRLTKRLVDLE